MKLFGMLLIASCFFTVSLAVTANDLLISNVTIVSSERDSPLSNVNVLIKNGKIHSITDKSLIVETKIDGSGYFLTPGLIDSHTHLRGIPGMLPKHFKEHKNIVKQAFDQIPKSYLYFGFTTVLDLMSYKGFIEQWNTMSIRPHAYFCGLAPIANGYPMAYLPETVRFKQNPNFLYDPRQRDLIPANINPDMHSPEAVVERIYGEGAICVKTAYEKGFGQQKNLPTPTVEMIRSLVKAAHAKDLPVFLHANSQEAHGFAVESGVDVIAHGMWHWQDKSAWTATPEIKDLIRGILENDIAYQPTIQVIHGERELFNDHYFEQPQVHHVIPESLIEWYLSNKGRWFRHEMSMQMGISENIDEPYTRAVKMMKVPIHRASHILKLLAKSSGRLLFGSDTPSGPIYTQFPGVNGWMEMHRWKEAGVSLEVLFKAATIANAKVMGLEEKIGSVEVGKDADLLLLRSNPLVSIKAYDEIEWVILRGKPIKRTELSAMIH